jgi:uncharacterized protein
MVVFGREPVPGRVKTRLAHTVGGGIAAAVYDALLQHTLAEAVATGLPVTLALAEAPSSGWEPPAGVDLELQCGGDLGERMAATFARHFSDGNDVVALVGSDVPAICSGDLLRAVELCRSAPAVLGPARDGGYWLIAQRAPGLDLFSGVPWSSSETLEVTRARLSQLGAHHAEVGQLSDVDTVADLTAAAVDPGVVPDLKRQLERWLRMAGFSC